jgi:hypothetical protein
MLNCIAATSARGETLRACFAPLDEGMECQILIGDCVVLRATADDGESRWPANPPWQEIQTQQDAAGRTVLMLVGKAGVSHWSMSVAADAVSPAIIFDVACRVRETPEFLGSTMETGLIDVQAPSAASGAIADGRSVELELRNDGLRVCIQLDPVEGTPPASLEVQGQRITIRAGRVDQLPATVRWKYRVLLEPE